ncbi:MAG TPA: cyclopropane-fatty-acyl-phospholipid synthase family protein [Gemmatimonadaceae bacterium]|nr:cyclopropane-fatty-acyl-phospholipid synthase family protein [Gemmatimonadaceae bacterium]
MTQPQVLPPRENSLSTTSDPVLRATHDALTLIFGPVESRTFAVRLWDGTTEQPTSLDSVPFTLVLRHPGALRRMFLPPSELAMAEAYVRGDFDVEGDVEAATALGDPIADRLRAPATLAHLTPHLLALPRVGGRADEALHQKAGLDRLGLQHAPERDAAAIRFHYDVGNDFYALWLDSAMMYSGAYFATGTEDLDSAQRAKLDYLCRKLRLTPGEQLLDFGCGWGGLIMHAAKHYGVKAMGITLSGAQAAFARERIAAAHLEEQCRVEVRDYRSLSGAEQFDKIVSVGMFEHVGRAKMREYFAQACQLLKAGGLFLNSGIVESSRPPFNRWHGWVARKVWKRGTFIDRYVFPDGELVPLEQVERDAAAGGLETRDVEELREHYAITLRHWVRRLERHRDEAIRLTSDATYRVWRLYMAASAHAFSIGRLGLVHVLFTKPGAGGLAGVPLTRTTP